MNSEHSTKNLFTTVQKLTKRLIKNQKHKSISDKRDQYLTEANVFESNDLLQDDFWIDSWMFWYLSIHEIHFRSYRKAYYSINK